MLRRLIFDERGNAFLDHALLMIILTLGVAGFVKGLANALGTKFGDLTSRVNQIGTP